MEGFRGRGQRYRITKNVGKNNGFFRTKNLLEKVKKRSVTSRNAG